MHQHFGRIYHEIVENRLKKQQQRQDSATNSIHAHHTKYFSHWKGESLWSRRENFEMSGLIINLIHLFTQVMGWYLLCHKPSPNWKDLFIDEFGTRNKL